MGKRKKDKKGKGAEKTALKTEKKADKRTKKLVKEQGEDDIENLIAQFKEEDKKREQIVEEKCAPPSARSNMSLTPHPDKDELIMFGGQFCNGAKTFMYNDMFVYNIRNNEWSQIKAPNAPPPRCSHQAVALKQGGGQLWIFGGEFESPKQLQFYHYNDLWVFHIKDKKWEKVNAKGGPSPRSGHRMVACKKQLLVFGGFYDVGDYKYFNDTYAFNLETYTWMKIEPSGIGPSPRSGCVLSVLQDQHKVLVYGGYSREKVKRDVDRGTAHTDMFLLVPDGKDKTEAAPTKWKWVSQKQSGLKPVGRCGMSLVTTPGNRALIFGGVYDEEDDDEHVKGIFYDDLFSLELDTGKWHEVLLRFKKESAKKKRRRKKSTGEGDTEVEEEDDDSEVVEEDVKRMKVSEDATNVHNDGVFSVSVGGPSVVKDDVFTVTVSNAPAPRTQNVATDDNEEAKDEVFWPSPRMNAQLAVKNGLLYLYGGLCEVGDKQLTLTDFYALDLHKLDEWKILIEDESNKQEWLESESDDDDSEDEKGAAAAGGKDDDSDDSDDDDDDSDMELGEAPDVRKNETLDQYFSRTKDYWLIKADDVASAEGLDVTTKQLKKAAKKMAEEFIAESAAKQ